MTELDELVMLLSSWRVFVNVWIAYKVVKLADT